MSLKSNWKTDTNKESKTGTVFDYGPDGKFTVKMLGGSNHAYGKKLQELIKPWKAEIQGGSLDPSILEGVMCDAFVSEALVGWEGVTDTDAEGKEVPLPYSPETAKALFREVPHFFNDISKRAMDFKNYRNSIREIDAKNSLPSSITS